MKFEDYWYIVAESSELTADVVLSRAVLGEWLAVVRGEDGKPVAFRDRCMHRAGRLSKGRMCKPGQLQCPYHGWTYDSTGELVAVPAEGDSFQKKSSRRLTVFRTCEQEGYVYVQLSDRDVAQKVPFAMPKYQAPGWKSVRLQNRFRNNVTNCVENFIDVPHTVFVHPGIFRTSRRQRVEATVRRTRGEVHVEYRGETDNLGWFKRFLNPRGGQIEHSDHFYAPNITSVYYKFSEGREFFITSQSIPCEHDQTLVYTDLSFNYGFWTRFAAPFVRWQGQQVIDQDIVALNDQMDVIDKYGDHFANTSADIIHVYVESIRKLLEKDGDPESMRDKSQDIAFWV